MFKKAVFFIFITTEALGFGLRFEQMERPYPLYQGEEESFKKVTELKKIYLDTLKEYELAYQASLGLNSTQRDELESKRMNWKIVENNLNELKVKYYTIDEEITALPELKSNSQKLILEKKKKEILDLIYIFENEESKRRKTYQELEKKFSKKFKGGTPFVLNEKQKKQINRLRSEWKEALKDMEKERNAVAQGELSNLEILATLDLPYLSENYVHLLENKIEVGRKELIRSIDLLENATKEEIKRAKEKYQNYVKKRSWHILGDLLPSKLPKEKKVLEEWLQKFKKKEKDDKKIASFNRAEYERYKKSFTNQFNLEMIISLSEAQREKMKSFLRAWHGQEMARRKSTYKVFLFRNAIKKMNDSSKELKKISFASIPSSGQPNSPKFLDSLFKSSFEKVFFLSEQELDFYLRDDSKVKSHTESKNYYHLEKKSTDKKFIIQKFRKKIFGKDILLGEKEYVLVKDFIDPNFVVFLDRLSRDNSLKETYLNLANFSNYRKLFEWIKTTNQIEIRREYLNQEALIKPSPEDVLATHKKLKHLYVKLNGIQIADFPLKVCQEVAKLGAVRRSLSRYLPELKRKMKKASKNREDPNFFPKDLINLILDMRQEIIEQINHFLSKNGADNKIYQINFIQDFLAEFIVSSSNEIPVQRSIIWDEKKVDVDLGVVDYLRAYLFSYLGQNRSEPFKNIKKISNFYLSQKEVEILKQEEIFSRGFKFTANTPPGIKMAFNEWRFEFENYKKFFKSYNSKDSNQVSILEEKENTFLDKKYQFKILVLKEMEKEIVRVLHSITEGVGLTNLNRVKKFLSYEVEYALVLYMEDPNISTSVAKVLIEKINLGKM